MNKLLAGAGILLALWTPAAAAAEWRSEAGASRLEIAATFEKAPVPGAFRHFDARLRFDADGPGAGGLQVTIDVTSADFGNADINKAIAGPEWFDFAHFLKAEFRATEIRRMQANRYLARGSLSLKGVQRPLEVAFAWAENGDTARMSGEFTVQRGSFGIGTGEWAATGTIGADVTVRFDVRLHKGE